MKKSYCQDTKLDDLVKSRHSGENRIFSLWLGLHAPKGLPAAEKAILVQAFEKVAKDPQIVSALVKAGYTSLYLKPEEVDKRIQAEYKVFQDLLTKIGLLKK